MTRENTFYKTNETRGEKTSGMPRILGVRHGVIDFVTYETGHCR